MTCRSCRRTVYFKAAYWIFDDLFMAAVIAAVKSRRLLILEHVAHSKQSVFRISWMVSWLDDDDDTYEPAAVHL